jgi:hypothetical protein
MIQKRLRTVVTTGDTGRLKRAEVRAVIIAIRDGKPLPPVTPIERATCGTAGHRPRKRA